MDNPILYKNNLFEKYAFNQYSQNGEDGIIQEIFNRLNINKSESTTCEFGAWDCKHLSNTFRLITHGSKALMIEGDKKKFQETLKTANIYKNIIPVNAYVSQNSDDNNCLDRILIRAQFPMNFDLLSIDIDSFDYQVWKSITFFKPKIVIIEISLPKPINDKYAIHDENSTDDGSSFISTYNLGIEKGYKLVCHSFSNLIFIDEDLINLDNFELNQNPYQFIHPNWIYKQNKKNLSTYDKDGWNHDFVPVLNEDYKVQGFYSCVGNFHLKSIGRLLDRLKNKNIHLLENNYNY